jgi:hypothetical protein
LAKVVKKKNWNHLRKIEKHDALMGLEQRQ